MKENRININHPETNDYNNFIKKSYKDMQEILFNVYPIKQYYEYNQFKKAKFDCTSLTYDNLTNRVKEIDFEFNGGME